jgi:hypothetical protein
MKQVAKPSRSFIRDKGVAIVVLCLTGFFTALSFRELLSRLQHHSAWLTDMRFLFPYWAAATVNVLFYAFFFWMFIDFYHFTRGRERVLVGSFGAAFLLGLVENLTPISTIRIIQCTAAALMAISFLTALDIFLRFSIKAESKFENNPPDT